MPAAESLPSEPTDNLPFAESISETSRAETAGQDKQLQAVFDAENLDIRQFGQTKPQFTQATANFLRRRLDEANSQPRATQRAPLPRGLVRNCLRVVYDETEAGTSNRQRLSRFVGEAYIRRLRFAEIQLALNLSEELPEDHFLQPCITDLVIGYGMAATQVRHGR